MVGDVLNRNVDILYNSRVVSDFRYKLIRYLIGVAVEETNPRNIGSVANTSDKLGKLVFAVEVYTVSGGILSYNVKLLYSECVKCGSFFDNILHCTASHLTSDKGNSTVCTAVVTSLCNLEVSHAVTGSENTLAADFRCFLIVKAGVFCRIFLSDIRFNCLYGFCNLVNTADTEKCVYLGKLLQNFLTVSFRKTSRNHNTLELVVLLEPADVNNVVYGFLFRTLDESTGVDDNNIRLCFLGSDFVALIEEVLEHYLCVAKIL